MSISRRTFIHGTTVGASSLLLSDKALADNNHKNDNPKKIFRNIVIFTADQLAKKGVSAYGNKDVNTPTIDNLITRGVRFENAYCSYPLCAPSRACFWTGQLPHKTGVIANDNPNIPETMDTIGSIFSEAGYECFHFGKRHDHGSLRGFTAADQIQKDFQAEPAFPVNYDTKEDVYCLEESIKYIKNLNKRKEKKPFILAVEFNNPHNINGWVGAFQGPHGDIEGIGNLPPLLDNFDTSDDLINRPKAIQYACCTHDRVKQAGKWNEKNFQQYLKAYYYYTELADNYIGQVIEALKKEGYYDDTLFVFFSDHGDSMGAHHLVAKMNWFYEEATNVPFAFSGPGIPAGVIRNELASLCDLLPTLCDLVGIEKPKDIYGKSLYPLLNNNEGQEIHDTIVTHWNADRSVDIQPARMIRDQKYKYILFKEHEEEELYDMDKDRSEKFNLAANPEYHEIKKKMREKLDKYIQNNSDPFYSQEVIVNQKYRSHELGYQNHEGETSVEEYLRTIRPLLNQKEFEKAREKMLSLHEEARKSYCQNSCEKT